MSQKKLYEAEAEVEGRNWKKRNSDIALRDINQEFDSQRFQLHQASRWADQAQRDKISVYGELELRNRLFQEDHARDCQEIEELRRLCCEETDRARQASIEQLSVHYVNNCEHPLVWRPCWVCVSSAPVVRLLFLRRFFTHGVHLLIFLVKPAFVSLSALELMSAQFLSFILM